MLINIQGEHMYQILSSYNSIEITCNMLHSAALRCRSLVPTRSISQMTPVSSRLYNRGAKDGATVPLLYLYAAVPLFAFGYGAHRWPLRHRYPPQMEQMLCPVLCVEEAWNDAWHGEAFGAFHCSE
jgi:hypothetical protein